MHSRSLFRRTQIPLGLRIMHHYICRAFVHLICAFFAALASHSAGVVGSPMYQSIEERDSDECHMLFAGTTSDKNYGGLELKDIYLTVQGQR